MALGEQLTPWVPGRYRVLGTDGMGRSETREALRRHFGVDAESVTFAALSELAEDGVFETKDLVKAQKSLGLDPEQPNALYE